MVWGSEVRVEGFGFGVCGQTQPEGRGQTRLGGLWPDTVWEGGADTVWVEDSGFGGCGQTQLR